jgi:hypothetical protein
LCFLSPPVAIQFWQPPFSVWHICVSFLCVWRSSGLMILPTSHMSWWSKFNHPEKHPGNQRKQKTLKVYDKNSLYVLQDFTCEMY